MNDQNRLRLDRMAARLAKHGAEAGHEPAIERDPETDPETAYLAAFTQVRDDVLRPVMGEVGEQLERAGYSFRISPGGEEGSPSVDFHIVLPERAGSKDTIRFFARKDPARGWQVIAELELKGSPFELTRFENTDEITHDVAEQLIVDAVEQMFASTPAASRTEDVPEVTAVGSTPPPPPPAPEAASAGTRPSPAAEVVASAGAPSDDTLPRQVLHVTQAPGGQAPPPDSRWANWAGRQELGETEEVSIAAFRSVALPFTEGPPAPSFFVAADESRETPRIPRSDHRNETMALPVIRLPGEQDGRDPALTVEQYAAFCAELTVFPDEAADIHRKYRVASAEGRAALDAAFVRRFGADPTLQRRWRALVDHYGAWYREAPKRSSR